MTGFSNVIGGVLHELARNPTLEAGLSTLLNDILAAFAKHAATTATTVDDSIASLATVAAPFVMAKYVGVPNGANN